MKNIAILIPGLKIGGSERSVSNISKLISCNNNLYIVLFDSSDIAYDYCGTILDLNCKAKRNIISKIINRIKRIYKLKKLIKQKKIDIVYSFTGIANIINSKVKTKAKRILSCRGFGDLLARENIMVKQLKACNGLVFNSNYMKTFFDKRHPELSSKTFFVYNCFDFKNINELSTEQTEAEFDDFINIHKTIVAVGRFCEEKGFDNLIKSFSILKKNVKEAGLVLIGDGKLKTNLIELINNLGISDSVYFTGFQKNPYKYMKKCDIFTLSSRNEGFPNVVVEAMACDLPVICTNCKSGPNEILNSNYNHNFNIEDIFYADYGILIPDFNNEPDYNIDIMHEKHYIYAKAMEELLLDINLKKQYINKSIERKKFYYYNNIVKYYLNIFENL